MLHISCCSAVCCIYRIKKNKADLKGVIIFNKRLTIYNNRNASIHFVNIYREINKLKKKKTEFREIKYQKHFKTEPLQRCFRYSVKRMRNSSEIQFIDNMTLIINLCHQQISV